jgi:hypothetical protein
MTSSPSVAPLAKIPDTKVATTTNVPTVLKPLLGGTCPTGYHLVSGTVCIKDLPPTATTKTTATPATTNVTIPPSSTTSQPSGTSSSGNDKNTNDNSDNQENFKTKILKSFNKKFK